MLEKRLRLIGQDHIAKLLEEDAPFISRQEIEKDLGQTDMSLVNELIKGNYLYHEPDMENVAPAEIIPASFAESDEARSYRKHGEELLKKGRVAVLIVAGGQGSRLGIEAPKGVVEVSPVRSKSLFQIHAEKILALSRRYSRPVPLFIMTSRENDDHTRRYFKDHSFFGLNPEDVFFFTQGMLPSVAQDGKLIISRQGGLFMNPDGHGGTLAALRRNGCLETLESRGIEEIFFFQVDNPLVFVCDPLFIGLHSLRGAQMSSKVVRKRDFGEKVGIIAKVEGKARVIEYSDMSDDMRYAVDDRNEILYWGGNAAIHMIRRDFIESLTGADRRLPFHRAHKTISTVDSKGNPAEIKGVKFETFIFDALPLAENTITMEVIREHEFAPVKNRTGEDSLESSKIMQSNLHKSWLKHLGIEVGSENLVEICPLFAMEKDDLAAHIEHLPIKIVKDTYIG
ncbi:MAG TPA: UDPGP type 1 family protein [Deltaproteobacteria bacterium]|jgi:UDP-N-acetylglucosamine/UDP-N-acetylgalactosamine diphosphorylase|nr:UDPGP type 1 family protein [Deltaproteobacteria bacterium]HQI02550.1 UDPGP type 1 family protein [Deltaproteobacteria bacterium]